MDPSSAIACTRRRNLAEDRFQSIPVYRTHNGEVIERYCQRLAVKVTARDDVRKHARLFVEEQQRIIRNRVKFLAQPRLA